MTIQNILRASNGQFFTARRWSHVRALAVDAIQEVCNFLKKVKMEQVNGIGFSKIRAFQKSCPGMKED